MQNTATFMAGFVLTGCLCGNALGARSFIVVDTDNTIPGVTACSCYVDGEGADWSASVVLVELTAGSVYNGSPDSDLPQDVLWAVPGLDVLEWDTWVGIPGDDTSQVAGGASDLGSPGFSMSGNRISVAWFNTLLTDTGPTRIANFSFTDDAEGTFQVLHLFDDGSVVTQANHPIGSGFCVPEPGALALLVVGGLGLRGRSRAGASGPAS